MQRVGGGSRNIPPKGQRWSTRETGLEPMATTIQLSRCGISVAEIEIGEETEWPGRLSPAPI